jgi:hypothetical protein
VFFRPIVTPHGSSGMASVWAGGRASPERAATTARGERETELETKQSTARAPDARRRAVTMPQVS